MSLFKKPKRQFRGARRKGSDSEQEEDDEIEIIEEVRPILPGIGTDSKHEEDEVDKPVVKKKKKKGTHKANKVGEDGAVSLLSFGDEETFDGTEFKLKKSKRSQIRAKQIKEEHIREKQLQQAQEMGKRKENQPAKSETNTQMPAAGEYTKEMLKRLREEQYGGELTLNGSDAENESDSDGVYENGERKKKTKSVLQSGVIPNAAAIHAARKKRQQAREQGDVPDYIPLDDTQRVKETTNTKSRLIREDDNDRSDHSGDEEHRMNFTINKAAEDKFKIQQSFLDAEHKDDVRSSDEEEFERWEREQIRKGVSAPQGVGDLKEASALPPYLMSSNLNNSPASHYSDCFAAENNETSLSLALQLGREKPPDDLENLPAITVEMIRLKLHEKIESFHEVHRSHQRDTDTIQDRLIECESQILSCEKIAGKLASSYAFFQEMRGYVRDLVDCYNEKMFEIKKVEADMHALWKDRSSRIVERRQRDIKDQSDEFTTNQTVADASRSRRAAEREARRGRRRRARQAKHQNVSHHEGMSTDDEQMESEIQGFSRQKDEIEERAGNIMEDAIDEFSTLEGVMSRFERWKEMYPDTYEDAYISMCMAKVFMPLVRLNLLSWNPVAEEDTKNLEDLPWYRSLLFFGWQGGGGGGGSADLTDDNPDDKVLPSVVEKVVLPKIKTLVELSWDPLSSQQTQRLVTLVRKLTNDYPTVNGTSKHMQALLKAVVERLRKTLDDDVFMPLYSKEVIYPARGNVGGGVSNPCQFFNRQFWTCVKLLGNILKWSGILSDAVVKEMALSALLNRYVLLALINTDVLKGDCVEKCQQVVYTFPKVWFEDLDANKTLSQLENLARVVVSMAANMHQISMSKEGSEMGGVKEMRLRSGIKDLLKLLFSIHAMDHAKELAKKCGNIKDVS